MTSIKTETGPEVTPTKPLTGVMLQSPLAQVVSDFNTALTLLKRTADIWAIPGDLRSDILDFLKKYDDIKTDEPDFKKRIERIRNNLVSQNSWSTDANTSGPGPQ